MKLMRIAALILSSSLFLFSGFGCSMQKLAVGATGGIIEKTLESLYEEPDLKLAETSIAANLKMLDGLIKSDPGNSRFLQIAVEGYTGYALAFAEDEEPARAQSFYKRAKEYGILLLRQNKRFSESLDGSLSDFEAALQSMKTDDVPALFWTANAWASYINMSRADVNALMDLPRALAMMQRVLELDERFYFGGPHYFFGTIYASLGMAGGNPQKAKMHFEKALEISEGKFLMTRVFYARYYAVSELDEELFKNELHKVIETPGDILPEYRLLNEVAKKKARLYLSQMDELF